MSFSVTFRNAHFLKRLCDTVKELVGNNRFVVEFGPGTGAYLQAMDASRVCLLVARIPEAALAGPLEAEGGPVSACLDATRLQKTLRMCDADLPLTMRPTPSGDVLRIDSGPLEFLLPLLHAPDGDDENRFEVPEAPEPEAFVGEFACGDLGRLFKDLAAFGDTLEVSAQGTSMFISVRGEDGLVARTRIAADRVLQDAQDSGEQRAAFSLTYLVSLFKGSFPSNTNLRLEIQEDRPIVLTFSSDRGETVQAFLAPKIRDTDEDA
jgi:hypothetical protein